MSKSGLRCFLGFGYQFEVEFLSIFQSKVCCLAQVYFLSFACNKVHVNDNCLLANTLDIKKESIKFFSWLLEDSTKINSLVLFSSDGDTTYICLLSPIFADQ